MAGAADGSVAYGFANAVVLVKFEVEWTDGLEPQVDALPVETDALGTIAGGSECGRAFVVTAGPLDQASPVVNSTLWEVEQVSLR